MKFNLTSDEIVFFLLFYLLIHLLHKHHKRIRRWLKERFRRRRRPRQLQPRSPCDCPLCATGVSWLPRRPKRDVVPWSRRKSKAGRPKMIDTRGYACLVTYCDYFGITDPEVQALVGYGRRGQDRIQHLLCQGCGTSFSTRRHTIMNHLKTPIDVVDLAMKMISEGLDISKTARILEKHPETIARWVHRGGRMSARLHTRLFFRSLAIGHLQLDELYAKVKRGADQVWVWTAIAAKSKLLVAFHVGGRKIEDAQCLLHQVWQRLQPQQLPVFTSDGLNHYFYGITAHFRHWQKPPRARKYHWFPNVRLQYAQLRKRRSGRKVSFLFSIIRLGTRQVIRGALHHLGLSGIIQTAYVARSNLTLRHLVAALARRTWSLAHDIYHLWLYINWGFAYYNFVRAHDSLRIRGPSRRRHRTPAMAAGLTFRPWSVRDLLLLPMPEGIWIDSYPA